MRLVPAAAAVALGLLALASAAPAAQGDVARGKASWDRYCANCHGPLAAGDGVAALRMLPRPRAFRDNPVFKLRRTPSGELPLAEDLFRTITAGIPGTAMPGWAHLPEQERWDQVAWIETTAAEFSDPAWLQGRVEMPDLGAVPPPAGPDLVARGREVYAAADCRKCHGDRGRGNGPSWADQVDDAHVPSDPADLTRPDRFRGGARIADVFRTLSTGMDGSAMASFADTICVADRQALAAYVVSLSEDAAPAQVLVAGHEAGFDPADEAAWAGVNTAVLPLAPQLARAPRLLWPSVDRVLVQAVHDGRQIHLRVRWHDREHSAGAEETGAYPDFDSAVHRGTPHADRLAIQFQDGRPDPRRLPSFLLGEAGRAVAVWTASALRPDPVEAEARGAAAIVPVPGGALRGRMAWDDGCWTLVASRGLASGRRDGATFAVGDWSKVGFSVWDGARGEAGTRHSVSSWTSLYVAPKASRLAAVLPLGRAAVGLFLMLAIGAIVRRWQDVHRPGA